MSVAPLRSAFSSSPSSLTPAVHPLHIGLVGTYPPQLCGIATFTAALEAALLAAGHRVDVVRLDNKLTSSPSQQPNAVLVSEDTASLQRCAAQLSTCDVVLVQHEFGIFGGPDGNEVLALLDLIGVPTIVSLHTVPMTPTAGQFSVLAAILDRVDRSVVMSNAARARLLGGYPIAERQITMIPHGATRPNPFDLKRIRDAASTHPSQGSMPALQESPQFLTWGLLGPGKGIEHVIDALQLCHDIEPKLRYTVSGATHPNVLAREGDAYRVSLKRRAQQRGVDGAVCFDDTYRSVDELMTYVASAEVVVLPYDSHEQVTSGVLVDAIAAGRPVIATAFPHAVELLASGAGIVVPHGNPFALADAMRAVIEDRELLASMAAEARRLAPQLSWTAVARSYAQLSRDVMALRNRVAV